MGDTLIGVKVHGFANYVYIVEYTVAGGANLMVEILPQTVLKLEAEGNCLIKSGAVLTNGQLLRN